VAEDDPVEGAKRAGRDPADEQGREEDAERRCESGRERTGGDDEHAPEHGALDVDPTGRESRDEDRDDEPRGPGGGDETEQLRRHSKRPLDAREQRPAQLEADGLGPDEHEQCEEPQPSLAARRVGHRPSATVGTGPDAAPSLGPSTVGERTDGE
jgi:hypothetical protein